MIKRIQSTNVYRFLSLLGTAKKTYMLLLMSARFTTLIQGILFALLLKLAIDSVAEANTTLYVSAVGITLLLFVLIVLDFYLHYVLTTHTNTIIGQIRLRLIDHLTKISLRYFDSQQSGELISRLTYDIHSIDEAFTRKIINLNSALTGGIITLIVIFVMDWRMGIFSVIVGTLFCLPNVCMAPKFRRIAERLHSHFGYLTSKLHNALTGIRTIKLFHLYDQQCQAFHKDNKRLYTLFVQQGKYGGMLEGINTILTYVSTIGVFAFGVLLTFQGTISIGTVVAILFLQASVTSMFLFTGNFVADLQQALVSTTRVSEILDLEPEREYPPATSTKNELNDADIITLRNIYFGYQSSGHVLTNLNLFVREGEMVALVGPSGSGKSTIFKLIMGFYPIDSGSIIINKRAIHDYALSELRQSIAYVPQDPTLFHATIKENIRYGNSSATNQEVIDAAKKAHAHSFIERLPNRYDTIIAEDSTNLSGGERQRIAIARAFVKNAPILLLDEPTSALDAQSEQYVQIALKQLMVGRTTLIIAHRLTTVQRADTIFVIDNGKVVEQGDHHQLLRNQRLYSELYQK